MSIRFLKKMKMNTLKKKKKVKIAIISLFQKFSHSLKRKSTRIVELISTMPSRVQVAYFQSLSLEQQYQGNKNLNPSNQVHRLFKLRETLFNYKNS